MNSVTLLSLVAVLQTVPPVPGAKGPPDAYLDPGAAVLVAGARAASDSANAGIDGYDVIARQRITAGVRIVGRSRPVYRQELAANLAWRKGGHHRVEVLGAREAAPIVRTGTSVVDDPASDAEDLLFEPTELFILRIGSGSADAPRGRRRVDPPDAEAGGGRPQGEVRSGGEDEDDLSDEDDEDDDFDVSVFHPLAPGSEEHYQFRSGEETTIRLQGGRIIRLIELQVLPRRSTPRLLRGSFWLEEESHRPVRGVFTLASPLTVRVPPRGSHIPLPSLSASFEIRHVAVEYALWESRWWMPRLTSFEGTGRIAGVTGSVVFEQLYEGFRVYSAGDTIPAHEVPDTTRYAVHEECEPDDEDCASTLVLVPRDTAVLLNGPHLPESIFAREGRLADDRTLRELASLVDAAAGRALASRTPRFDWTVFDASMLRFNRVEGLTLGGSARVDLAPYALSMAARIGTADATPSGRVAFSSTGYNRSRTIELYRGVEAFTPEDRPFSLGSSLAAFFFGRDEGDYYRATGIALAAARGDPTGAEFTTRIYHERQRPVETGTNASIPYWFDDREFRPNPAADDAAQYGVEARASLSRGLNPTGFRFNLDLSARAEAGSYRFARASTGAYLSFPMPGRLLGVIEAGGGSSLGDLPLQRLWYVGGPATVRGIAPEDRIGGEAFWRARGEIGTRNPGARLVLFGDAGAAASRDALGIDPALLSVGAGISLLDGLFRADVARALRGSEGWSVRLRLDAAM